MTEQRLKHVMFKNSMSEGKPLVNPLHEL